jgi:hypothetical protein
MDRTEELKQALEKAIAMLDKYAISFDTCEGCEGKCIRMIGKNYCRDKTLCPISIEINDLRNILNGR